MMEQAPAGPKGGRGMKRTWIFPSGVLVLYGMLYLATPGKIALALKTCAKVGLSLVVPLAFVVAVLVLVNLLVRPSQVAVFLYNRAVKPFLVPVMIGYFGWRYVLALTALMILGSILLGYGMQILGRKH